MRVRLSLGPLETMYSNTGIAFVGGPKDGDWRAVPLPLCPWFEVYIKPDWNPNLFWSSDDVATIPDIKKHRYLATEVALPMGDVTWFYCYYRSEDTPKEQVDLYNIHLSFQDSWMSVDSWKLRKEATLARADAWMDFCIRTGKLPDYELVAACIECELVKNFTWTRT